MGLVAVAVLAGPASASPRAAAPQRFDAAQADSAAAVERARSAQGRFERERVRRIPLDRWGFSGGGCDERVGRMCLRLEGGSDWWWPEEEDVELTEARARLIELLADAARTAPGDPWILGQRVVYLGEAGRWPEAERIAARCGVRAEVRWWCDALTGLALHVRGDYQAAAARFRVALEGMDPAEAERWSDVRDLLTRDGDDARKRALERGDTAAVVRFWTLSDPLFLVPGNDRWTEHMARRTWSRTREGARNSYSMSWGSDLDELLVRYGWEVGWERRDPGASIGVSSSAVGHQDPRSQGFVAPAAAWDASPESPREEWNPGSRTLPRTGYAPAYAPTFLDLDATVMRLNRGDSTVLVVRVPGVPEDTTFHAGHDHPPAPDPSAFRGLGPVHGLFAFELSGAGELHGVRGEGEAGSLVLTVAAGTDYVVSVETWDPDSARAGRQRSGMSVPFVPRDVPVVSDLLLARAEGELPERLDGLLDALHPGNVFAPGDTIRVAWEVHGLGWRREQLGYRVEVREAAGGFLSRLGRTIGVVGDRRGQDLRWTEAGPETPGPLFRAVDVVIPEDFEDGRFTLRLEVSSTGRNPLVTQRDVEVRRKTDRR